MAAVSFIASVPANLFSPDFSLNPGFRFRDKHPGTLWAISQPNEFRHKGLKFVEIGDFAHA
jgi:hypothetical protein